MTDAVPQFTDARGLLYRPGLLDPDGARLTVRTPGEDVPHELPS